MSDDWRSRARAAWEARDAHTRAWADALPDDHKEALNRRIWRLADLGRCSSQARFWLTTRKQGDKRGLLTFGRSADAETPRGHPALRLDGLKHLADGAALSIAVQLDSPRLRGYTVGLFGALRAGGAPWFSHVDLTEEPEGQGVCGHPLLHAHVGGDPGRKFQARAPLPRLAPADALDWLLATVDPALEL